MNGPLRIDLHVHSAHSPDARDTPAQLVARARALGLDGLALTDHNSVAGLAEAEDAARAAPGFWVLPGVEVSTIEGHLLALGVRTAPASARPLAETIDWVRAQGGEPVLAHPFRWIHGVGGAVARTARVAAIETVNGHTGARRNERAGRLAAERGVGTTGGSDAHRSAEVGRALTIFPPGVGGTDDLLEALRRGRTIASGASLDRGAQLRTAVRSGWLRVRRGFRPI